MNGARTAQDALLSHAEVVGAQLSRDGALQCIHNPALLAQWLGDEVGAALPERVDVLLERLFGSRYASLLHNALQGNALGATGSLELGVLTTRLQVAAFTRRLRVTLQMDATNILVLRDVSQREALLQELQDAHAARDTALAVLRAPPDGLRLFLGSAMASVTAIRATLRMPARTQDALREKLARVNTDAMALAAEARMLALTPVDDCCQALADAAAALRTRETISGDELLPLAPRVDAIASAIGRTSRIEEQRHEASPTVTEPLRQSRRGASWHEVSERRWSEFLRRRGEDIGTLARLTMSGSELVPVFHRRHVDEILLQLLRNSVDHGIETPEERLTAGKSAAGRITIGFSRAEHGRLKMTVHDDGRGFDLTRIARAAVCSGLVSEESLARRDAGELVGMIFKPSFSTEGLDAGDGQGRGMSYLRRKITRLGGQISVATKQGHYTLFTIELPESEISDESAGGIPRAAP